jgi:DNA-binding transcriptional regulator GbsR (MarR family)
MNKSLNDIKHLCLEWNSKCKPAFTEHELEYQVKYMFDNLDKCNYDCKNCEHKGDCFSIVESDFVYKDDILLTMSENVIRYCKKSRKGVKDMTGNELLIYSTLKLHDDGLYTDEIVKEITYQNKARLSEPTLIKALKGLLEDEFITCKRDKKGNFYQINDINSKIELTYTIGFSATLCCIKKEITTEELRLYNYMRFLHHKKQRENTTTLKGNLFQIDQRELAEDLGTSQPNISTMISNLINEKLISIWYRGKSKNNQYDYNIYRLNI